MKMKQRAFLLVISALTTFNALAVQTGRDTAGLLWYAKHMFALHPGHQIAPASTPKLAEAAKVSLSAIGDGGTGWSKIEIGNEK